AWIRSVLSVGVVEVVCGDPGYTYKRSTLGTGLNTFTTRSSTTSRRAKSPSNKTSVANQGLQQTRAADGSSAYNVTRRPGLLSCCVRPAPADVRPTPADVRAYPAPQSGKERERCTE